MNGILVNMTQEKAKTTDRKKSIEIPEDILDELAAGDAVIGITPGKGRSKGDWIVSFAAYVKRVSKREGLLRLKYTRAWPASDSWELPLGLPSNAHFDERGCELLEDEKQVHASLLGASVISKLFTKLGAQQRGHFHLSTKARDGLVIVFKDGEPRVWSREAYEDNIFGDMEAYAKVMRRFLSQLAEGNTKGWIFEDILEELFKCDDFNFEVEKTKATGDGGIDLKLQRTGAVVGKELYLVQAKNQEHPIEDGDIRIFQSVCENNNAQKGIFVAPGGFNKAARDYVLQYCPSMELVGLDHLVHLLSPRLCNMPHTKELLNEWRERRSTGQQALQLQLSRGKP